jgi:divalent metal cation (Fe/Co/Zn/Cd) transporter
MWMENMPLNQVHMISDQVIERLESFPEVDRAFVTSNQRWD